MKGSLQDINHLIASDNIAKLLKTVTVPSPQTLSRQMDYNERYGYQRFLPANIKHYLSRITERSIK